MEDKKRRRFIGSKHPHPASLQSELVQSKRLEMRAPSRRVRGLDGLRALAAAAVLAYHLLPNTVAGGFLGVDVFFVLSGFLITALLVREHERFGHINLKAFWLRRIRRLLPAVSLMVVITLIVSGLLNRDLLAGIRMQFLGAITFSYNWVEIFQGVSYFNQAEPHLWTNVWSLAVEQQFYLLWPLLVLGILFLNKRWRPLVPLALGLMSAGWMAYLVSGAGDFTRAYQGTDSHAFGLMFGAALALFAHDPLGMPKRVIPPARRRLRIVLGWVCLALIISGWFFVPDDKAWAYPWGTLVAVFATIGVIQMFLPEVDEGGSVLGSILEWSPLVWIGQRSYGIYLWHWPVWVIATRMLPNWSLAWAALLVIVVSVLAATLSFRYVEVPMRQVGILATIKRWLGPSWNLIDPSTDMPKTSISKKDFLRNYRRIMAPGLVGILVVGAVLGFLLSSPDKTSAQIAVERGQAALEEPEPTPFDDVITPEPPEPEPAPFDPATGETTAIYGDSVTVGAAPQLQEALPGVLVDGKVSRHFYEGINIIREAAANGNLRPYVVVALATNGPVSPEELDQLLEAIGPDHRLVLVTGFGPKRIDWIEPSASLIRQYVEAHPDNVRLADWGVAIADHTDLLASDFIHTGPDAGRIFASTVVDALASFSK